MTILDTPGTGIRLSNGEKPPPAPSLGIHRPANVTRPRLIRVDIGYTVEKGPGKVAGVCGWCQTILDPCIDHQDAVLALSGHWDAVHEAGAA